MSLFTGLLKLDPEDKARLKQMAESSVKVAATLQAFLAKANEDDAAQQARVDELTARVEELTAKLEAKGASTPSP